jgi:hypothetical protein
MPFGHLGDGRENAARPIRISRLRAPRSKMPKPLRRLRGYLSPRETFAVLNAPAGSLFRRQSPYASAVLQLRRTRFGNSPPSPSGFGEAAFACFATIGPECGFAEP